MCAIRGKGSARRYHVELIGVNARTKSAQTVNPFVLLARGAYLARFHVTVGIGART
jgi:hypothetical protein